MQKKEKCFPTTDSLTVLIFKHVVGKVLDHLKRGITPFLEI